MSDDREALRLAIQKELAEALRKHEGKPFDPVEAEAIRSEVASILDGFSSMPIIGTKLVAAMRGEHLVVMDERTWEKYESAGQAEGWLRIDRG